MALVVALFSLRGIAGFYTDYLWFGELHITSVWKQVLGAKIILGAVFTAVFFVVMWANLAIADLLAPKFRPMGPEEEIVERYHQIIGSRAGLVRVALAGVFAGVGQTDWARRLADQAESITRSITDPYWRTEASAVLIGALGATEQFDRAESVAGAATGGLTPRRSPRSSSPYRFSYSSDSSAMRTRSGSRRRRSARKSRVRSGG